MKDTPAAWLLEIKNGKKRRLKSFTSERRADLEMALEKANGGRVKKTPLFKKPN